MNGRLREIARQTMAVIDAGGYRTSTGEHVALDQAVRAAVAATRLHLPDEPLAPAGPPATHTQVEVTFESTLAAAHGHRTLVLGAWGCGVFRNDPHTVAGAFADAMRVVDYFDRVVFAIHDRLPGTPVYAAFADILGTSHTKVRAWRTGPEDDQAPCHRP